MNTKLFLRFCLIAAIAGLPVLKTNAQDAETNIRIDQLGYYPAAPKIAVVLAAADSIFYLQTPARKTVFSAKLKRAPVADFAGNYPEIADFTVFGQPGKYVLYVPSLGYSYPFEIGNNVHSLVARASIKAYYFMRVSTPLPAKYAGKWARAEGHPDTAVLVHPSAASDKRPAGTVISSPGGWYDAGDYNKYIVNSGISTGTLLSLDEDFPGYIKNLGLNLPESGNGVPDELNEVLWNLRWMLTMQDPNDGGVYHKLTNAGFDKFIMPDKAVTTRYVVQKGTAATLDFAAVMAQASRIFKAFPKQLPGLADSCLQAAEKAWAWAKQNPNLAYDQDAMNRKYNPKVTTGAYGDRFFSDEFIWAASELYVSTGDNKFLEGINLLPDARMPLPAWGQVRLLGYYTLAKHAPPGLKELPEIKARLVKFADSIADGAAKTAYLSPLYESKRNFTWGSNSVAANQGVALVQAYLLTGNNKYLDAALDDLDYLFGRNGTGYCYVTGYGDKSPMNPHHRPSYADGVVEPVPGMLVGGPNPGMQDGIKVPSAVPDEAYTDDYRAYAVNEIAINWNAPLAYLANALEALQVKLKPVN